MIRDCLVSLEFADEIIVVDSGNTDATNEIAKQFNAKIIEATGAGYDDFRNAGLKAASGKWLLYVDADERVSPLLREEIKSEITNPNHSQAYLIPRQNMFLGKQMHYGGWGNDRVIRLFNKPALHSWKNKLHEQPEYSGALGKLNNQLIHFSHRDLTTMLDKTLVFTKYEADLRLAAKHPPIQWWRFLRVMATEFWLRFVKLTAWKDGVEGVIDGMFQVFNAFIIYARVWEGQLSSNESRHI